MLRSAMLIDDYLPVYDFHDENEVAIMGDSDTVWAAARYMDLGRSWWVRPLFGLRSALTGLPSRPRRNGATARWSTLTIDDLVVTEGPGFIKLAETPGREVVIGAAGQFWTLKQRFTTVTPASFVALRGPGIGKVAWSLQVEAAGPERTFVRVQGRVELPNDRARRAFARYWKLFGRLSHALRASALRRLARDVEGGR